MRSATAPLSFWFDNMHVAFAAGSHSVHWSMSSSIPGLCPLAAHSTPIHCQLCQPTMSPDIVICPLEGRGQKSPEVRTVYPYGKIQMLLMLKQPREGDHLQWSKVSKNCILNATCIKASRVSSFFISPSFPLCQKLIDVGTITLFPFGLAWFYCI